MNAYEQKKANNERSSKKIRISRQLEELDQIKYHEDTVYLITFPPFPSSREAHTWIDILVVQDRSTIGQIGQMNVTEIHV